MVCGTYGGCSLVGAVLEELCATTVLFSNAVLLVHQLIPRCKWFVEPALSFLSPRAILLVTYG
jgi:hypothetical protein